MSQVTVDQVFLAPGLAALGVRSIVGDIILIRSGDERDTAAFHVPAGEVLETKAILSTYHQQARAGSEALADSAGVFVNER